MAWASGPRDESLAHNVVLTTRQRTRQRRGIAYLSDGWTPYTTTIPGVYRDREPSGIRPGWDILRPTPNLQLTQAVKHRKGRRLERVEVRTIIGAPIACPYAVHLERLNGTLRDRLGCLTRKTHAFAKETATWDALFNLTLFEHNWLRSHIALRVPLAEPTNQRRYAQRTPAMALDISDHPWTWQEFLCLPIHSHP